LAKRSLYVGVTQLQAREFGVTCARGQADAEVGCKNLGKVNRGPGATPAGHFFATYAP